MAGSKGKSVDIQHGDTEQCGRVVGTPASYSGGPGSKSRPRDRLS
jgi:hypothetical protein